MSPRRRKLAGRVPPELRLAYGARALPLGEAILAILPPPPTPGSQVDCSGCGGRADGGCIVCRRMGHLLREGDPIPYRRLVTRAICAVSPDAPPPPRPTPGNAGYSQSKIVNQTVRWIIKDHPFSAKNVLGNSYGEDGRVRRIADLVCTPSWDVLLHRIGDLLMCFILGHSSIFLLVKRRDYFQVTGAPLNVVLRKPMFFRTTTAKNQQVQSLKSKCAVCSLWHTIKRTRAMYEENYCSSLGSGRDSLRPSCQKIDIQQNLVCCGSVKVTKESTLPKYACNCHECTVTDKSSQHSDCFTRKCGKGKRLYSWQRRSKQKERCADDHSSTERKKLKIDDVNVSNQRQIENSAMTNGELNDEKLNSLEPTVAGNSLVISCENENPFQVKRMYHKAFLPCAKNVNISPSAALDDRPVQDLCFDSGTSGVQPTSSQVRSSGSIHVKKGLVCFNCLMLNASKNLSVDSLITRQAIFYNRTSSYNVFRGNHILKKENKLDALPLIKHIFGIRGCCLKFLRCICDSSPMINSSCLYHWLLQLMTNLIKNSKRCQYKKLLLKHCPLKAKVTKGSFSSRNTTKSDSEPEYPREGKQTDSDQCFALLESYSKHNQVTSFVWAVLKRIIPEPLLGNSDSQRSLRKNIWKFIKLRRFEKFHLNDCISGLKVSQYAWLSTIRFFNCFCAATMRKEIGLSSGEEHKKKNLLHRWIGWLFSDILIPLMRAYFYITERESKRLDVFYYPKPLWRKLTTSAISFLKGKNFRLLRGASRKAVKHTCCFSQVRFLPKAKTVRLLVNLKAQSKIGILNKCHVIMKKMRHDNPEKFGSSVFDYNDVHENLCQFSFAIRSTLKVMPKIYIVVADVSKAFDSINQDMVLKIMEDVLQSNEYIVRKCTKVICNHSTNAVYCLESNASLCNGDLVSDFSIQLSSSGGIFVDQGTISRIRKEELRHLLIEQVKNNVLKIGQKFYLQQLGIAQGSKLSPILCSIYYGQLEKVVIANFLRGDNVCAGESVEVHSATPEYLLMRFIDDFIFLSRSRKLAVDFFNRMRRGFVDYNCYMNNTKYGFNFDFGNSKQFCNRLYEGEDGVSFIPWSGLLINCETLEIQADYTRYSDILVSSTITVRMHSSAQYLQKKLRDYMRPKCHPIFYDSNINSPATVKLNIYQAFLLCAMKFHCYLRSMDGASVNPPELLGVINGTFRYMHSIICRQMNDAELHYNVHPVLKLRRKETIWLGLAAYIRVLRKKQSRYTDLLALLTAEIERYGRMDGACDSLRYAIDDSHSSMFWKFKF